MKNVEDLTMKELVSLAHKKSSDENKDILSCYKEIFDEACLNLGVKFSSETYNKEYIDFLIMKGS